MLESTPPVCRTDNRHVPRRFAATVAVLAALSHLCALAAPAAAGETRLSARYVISVAGFPVGKADLNYALNDRGYTVDGFGRTSGVVRLFSDGEGKASAKGILNGTHPVPGAYSYDVTEDGDKETLTMAFSGNRVGAVELDPPEHPALQKRKVPLESAHKVDVLDPLSALFIPAGADNVCDRILPIFDGVQRFDLLLSPKRTDYFSSERRSFKGRVVVCAVSYRPIAGHRADKKEVQYMQRNSGMEIWMAPLGNTGIMAPVSARLETQVGLLVVDATRFQLQ